MKTFTFALAFALVLIAGISYAQFPQSSSPDSCCYVEDDLRAAIFEGNPDYIHVKVAKKAGEKVKVRVKNKNKTLYAQNYKKYARVDVQYDIREFPTGSYTFEIIQGKEVVFSKQITKDSLNVLSKR